MSKELFDQVSIRCSKITTRAYSTSFSLGIYCLDKKLRDDIYAIYGFVRFADEIVDTFHNYNKATLFHDFRQQTYDALKNKISLNPILNSFQSTVNQHQIPLQLIDQFLKSMESDLHEKKYNESDFKEYILGSAEVVGLMCLCVFCEGNMDEYEKLKPFAMKLGSAFQKVNFLRDLKADYEGMGRTYFPGLNMKSFSEAQKQEIQKDIEADFKSAYEGVKMLPRSSRLGVYIAYVYYLALFKKIKNTPSHKVLKTRIRIRNRRKISILCLSFLRHQFNLL